jgi:ketosteroid isomerase-like protein
VDPAAPEPSVAAHEVLEALHSRSDYRNEYCFVFEIEGGKIRRIREYVDMLTVKETLMS